MQRNKPVYSCHCGEMQLPYGLYTDKATEGPQALGIGVQQLPFPIAPLLQSVKRKATHKFMFRDGNPAPHPVHCGSRAWQLSKGCAWNQTLPAMGRGSDAQLHLQHGPVYATPLAASRRSLLQVRRGRAQVHTQV